MSRTDRRVKISRNDPEVTVTTRPSPPRDRLLETASKLFYAEGIKGVGVDRILAEAGITRATMYRHYPGKEALVSAYLEREDTIIRGYFEAAAAQRGTPTQLLNRVIDGIAEDARRYHRRGCPFINAAAEYPDADGEIRTIIARHRTWFRETLTALCKAAGVPKPAQAAAALVLLRDAALVGVYLDGDAVTSTFRRTARAVVGLG
jgi:AcrR family transcriptional regulator